MFGLELYRKLAREPGNLFCSPYSIEAALALVAGGAAGGTLAELVHTLGEADPVAFHEALAAELPKRNNSTTGVLLSIANGLWYQRGYPIVPAYVTAMESRLAAAVQSVDFAGNAAHAVELINDWTAKATRQKITKVVSVLPPTTRVILANAIYMKARWAQQFIAHATRPRPFTLTTAERVDVPTMARTGKFRYAKLSAMEAIELPYAGGALAMLIAVPKHGALGDVERVLDVDRVASALVERTVELAMPKFRVESTFRLRTTLQELGIVAAFGGGDFTPMTSEPGFFVDEVVHKTYVDVDEQGTEAAAVTVMVARGAVMRPTDVVQLHIDRPFLFAIRDIPTNTILFMGRVTDPR